MNPTIYVEPDELWSCFKLNSRVESNIVIVAENEEAGISIGLTNNSDGFATLQVFEGDNVVFEDCYSKWEIKEAAEELYEEYLFTYKLVNSLVNSSDETRLDGRLEEDFDLEDIDYESILSIQKDLVYEREDELLLAAMDFLEILMRDSMREDASLDAYDSGLAEIFVDIVCDSMKGLGVSVYRPKLVADGTEEEEYVEYPYGNGII